MARCMDVGCFFMQMGTVMMVSGHMETRLSTKWEHMVMSKLYMVKEEMVKCTHMVKMKMYILKRVMASGIFNNVVLVPNKQLHETI